MELWMEPTISFCDVLGYTGKGVEESNVLPMRDLRKAPFNKVKETLIETQGQKYSKRKESMMTGHLLRTRY